MKTTIIVPTYNEAENLEKLVAAVLALPLPDLNMLIVDDNSPDGTGEMAEQLGVQYDGRVKVLHRAGKMGLGTAYIEGFKFAIEDGAEAIGQMDADFSHPIEKIVELAETLESCDVVIGSRYVPGGSLDERWPFWRKALSRFGNFYARTILGLPSRDVTGGFSTLAAGDFAGYAAGTGAFQRVCFSGGDELPRQPVGIYLQGNPDLFPGQAFWHIQDVVQDPDGGSHPHLAVAWDV